MKSLLVKFANDKKNNEVAVSNGDRSVLQVSLGDKAYLLKHKWQTQCKCPWLLPCVLQEITLDEHNDILVVLEAPNCTVFSTVKTPLVSLYIRSL